MPKPSNGALVQRHRELCTSLINKAEQIGSGADRAPLGIKEKTFGLGNGRVDCDEVPRITGLTAVLD